MKLYGLIGRSLGHSFSKDFFTALFEQKNIEAEYRNFELKDVQEIESLFQLHPAGLNVTIPYKESVIPFLDELSSEAREIGAVNVIQFRGGKKIGHNTDAFGFHQSIKPFLTNRHERALIFGTGGASKAVAYVFGSIGIDVVFLSREPAGNREFSYGQLNDHMVKACKVIVNCTPVGTFPDVEEFIPLPFDALTPEHLVVDLIYNPSKTKLLQLAEEHGAQILNGSSMLREQALRAWEIWNAE